MMMMTRTRMSPQFIFMLLLMTIILTINHVSVNVSCLTTNDLESITWTNDQTLPSRMRRAATPDDEDDDEAYDDDEEEDNHNDQNLLDERVDNFLDDTVRLVNQGNQVLKSHLSKYNGDNNSLNQHNSDASSSSSSSSTTDTNINVNATGIWIGYGKAIQKIIDTFIRQSLPRVLDASYSTNVSTECTGAILQILTGLRRQDPWVMRMIDSMGRPIPAGISDGTITDFGSYDQCLGITGPDEIVGQYCLMRWAPTLPPRPSKLTLQTKVLNFKKTSLSSSFIDDLSGYAHAFYDRFGRYGICCPSTCSKEDIQSIVDLIFGESHFYFNINNCEIKQSLKLDLLQIILVAMIAFGVMLLVTATTIDYYLTHFRKADSPIYKLQFIKFILCFSISSNGKQLFSTKRADNAFKAIDGIRVISMIWIILTHTYLIPLKETFAFARHFIYVVEDVSFQFILNGWVLVDTFFCIGSMLATYSILTAMKRNGGKINLVQIIFNRLIRLTPNLWFTVCLMFIIPALGSGPLWFEYFNYQSNKCYNNWIATFFYYNNWFPETELCLLHTWYLSADMQLFIFTVLCLIIPLYKRPKLGLLLLVFIIMSSIAGNGFNTLLRRLPPTVIYNTPSELDVYRDAAKVYFPTYVHLGPYTIGVLLGYIFSKLDKRQVSIHWLLNLIIWCIAISGTCIILLSTLEWNRGNLWTPISSAVYAGLHRTSWSLIVAWITFSCTTGNGGIINTFLSWKIFSPLSKLSYSVYLLHFLVLWMRYASIRWTLPFSHYTLICEFLINLVSSTFIASLLYLLIEAPINRLHKLYLNDCFHFASFIVIKNGSDSYNPESSLNERRKVPKDEVTTQVPPLHNLRLNGFSIGQDVTRL